MGSIGSTDGGGGFTRPKVPRAASRIRRMTNAITSTSHTIWTVVVRRAASVRGAMSPKPTVEKTVTVKYSAETRSSGCVNARGSDFAIVRYVHANVTTKIGMMSAIASAARNIGRFDLRMARTSYE